jgi:uncharacterized protein (DUF736 family)
MADNKTSSDWDKREIGALWTRTSQGSGKKYFSGHFRVDTEFGEEKKIPVVAFYNKDKKSENQPDFRIYLSRPASEREQESSKTESPKTESPKTESPKAESQAETDSSEEDGDTLL